MRLLFVTLTIVAFFTPDTAAIADSQHTPLPSVNIDIEAENALRIRKPFVIRHGAGASQAAYVKVVRRGHARLDLSFEVPISGWYEIAGRVKAASRKSSSFILSIDDDVNSLRVWRFRPTSNKWRWRHVNLSSRHPDERARFYLTSGDHRLQLGRHALSARIDKLSITMVDDALQDAFEPVSSCRDGHHVSVSPDTFAKALKTARPCDILTLVPGHYSGLELDGLGGGVDQPVTITCSSEQSARNSEGCIIKQGGILQINRSDGVIIDGLSFAATQLRFRDVMNVRVQHVVFDGNEGDDTVVVDATNIQFINNTFRETASSTDGGYMTDYGIRLYRVGEALVRGNQFTGRFNHAVSTKENVDYIEIVDNLFVDCGRHCLEIGQNPSTTGAVNRDTTSGTAIIRNNIFKNIRINAITQRTNRQMIVEDNVFDTVGGQTIINWPFWKKYKDSQLLIASGESQRTIIRRNTFIGDNRLTFEGRGRIRDSVEMASNTIVGRVRCKLIPMDDDTAIAHSNEETTDPPELVDSDDEIDCEIM